MGSPHKVVVLSPVSRAAARLVALNVLLFSLLRLAFHLAFRASGGELDDGEVWYAFQLGLRFDLRLALLLVLPLLILGHLPWLRPDRDLSQRLWRGLYAFVGLFCVLVYFVDLGHYDYLHSRVNAALLNEALSVREAVGMVWSTYPIVRWALGFALLAVAYTWAVRLSLRAALPDARPAHPVPWYSAVVLGLLVAWGVYGNASWYPLRWSQAYFSTNRYISALALNPVLAFSESFASNSAAIDSERLRADYDLLCDTFGVQQRDPGSFSLARWVEPVSVPDFRPNLVIIHVESWAGFQNGFMGNPLDPSPRMDALVAESVLYERFFVPSGPTARSVFSMLTGVPDTIVANPVTTASRDPLMIDQHMLLNALVGWTKFYFLGGSTNWANIRGVTQGNIDDLVIYEEGSYGRERADIWGISDLELFEVAADVFSKQKGPFFAFLQTSGNHRPYTIPDYTADFVPATDIDQATLIESGFKSLEAYNGFRFMDHCLGRFFDLARQQPWYEDTIFVLYGDHGVPAVNDLPYEQVNLTHQHVPMLLHAPRLQGPPRRTTQPASSLDILPTCLSLMGVPYLDTALGRDLNDQAPANRFAYMLGGLLFEDGLFLRYDDTGARHLYRIGGPYDPISEVADEFPERLERGERLHGAFQEWAKWGLYNNKPRPHRPPQ